MAGSPSAAAAAPVAATGLGDWFVERAANWHGHLSQCVWFVTPAEKVAFKAGQYWLKDPNYKGEKPAADYQCGEWLSVKRNQIAIDTNPDGTVRRVKGGTLLYPLSAVPEKKWIAPAVKGETEAWIAAQSAGFSLPCSPAEAATKLGGSGGDRRYKRNESRSSRSSRGSGGGASSVSSGSRATTASITLSDEELELILSRRREAAIAAGLAKPPRYEESAKPPETLPTDTVPTITGKLVEGDKDDWTLAGGPKPLLIYDGDFTCRFNWETNAWIDGDGDETTLTLVPHALEFLESFRPAAVSAASAGGGGVSADGEEELDDDE